MKDTNLESIFEVLNTHGTVSAFQLGLCAFILAQLRTSGDLLSNSTELAKYHEKNLKRRGKKRNPKQTTVKLTMCIFLGDGKTESLEEELRLRELMDLDGEKGFPFC